VAFGDDGDSTGRSSCGDGGGRDTREAYTDVVSVGDVESESEGA
jgi:hypothetical protein